MTKNKWRPLQRAVMPPYALENPLVRQHAEQSGVTLEDALQQINAEESKCETYINDLYQVQLRRLTLTNDAGESVDDTWVHLNIRRRDGGVIMRDWRHFQRIKNELVGAECEGFEMYPAESRLVDTSNKYHIFVCTDPAFRFPFGWIVRDVDYVGGNTRGTQQRRLEPRLQP